MEDLLDDDPILLLSTRNDTGDSTGGNTGANTGANAGSDTWDNSTTGGGDDDGGGIGIGPTNPDLQAGLNRYLDLLAEAIEALRQKWVSEAAKTAADRTATVREHTRQLSSRLRY